MTWQTTNNATLYVVEGYTHRGRVSNITVDVERVIWGEARVLIKLLEAIIRNDIETSTQTAYLLCREYYSSMTFDNKGGSYVFARTSPPYYGQICEETKMLMEQSYSIEKILNTLANMKKPFGSKEKRMFINTKLAAKFLISRWVAFKMGAK